MKIALVIERMDTFRGGRERSTAQVAAALARAGHEVTILCREGSWRADGVRVTGLGSRGRTRRARLVHFVRDVRRETAGGRYDVVHAVFPLPGATIYQPRGGTIPGQRAASLRRKSAMARLLARLVRPLNRFRAELEAMERQVAADPRVTCLCVSRMIAEEFRRYYGRSENVRVVYNAVELPDLLQRASLRQALRAEHALAQEETLFLTVATNPGLKGLDFALRALAAVRSRGGQARLAVVGPRQAELDALAQRVGVAEAVIFAGRVEAEELDRWYAAADACVLLSWYDPCSRVILEALAWGLPGITTACNGASEALAGGAGITVESPDAVAAVAAAMENLADPSRRRACAEACAAQRQHVGMPRHMDELLNIYTEVAGR